MGFIERVHRLAVQITRGKMKISGVEGLQCGWCGNGMQADGRILNKATTKQIYESASIYSIQDPTIELRRSDSSSLAG